MVERSTAGSPRGQPAWGARKSHERTRKPNITNKHFGLFSTHLAKLISQARKTMFYKNQERFAASKGLRVTLVALHFFNEFM
jgi:hypothetical protein